MEKLTLLTELLTPVEKAIVKNLVEDPVGEFKTGEYKEKRLLPNSGAAMVKYVFEEMDVKSGDVFVVSYPKTGTNWMCEILKLIFYNQDQAQLEISKALPLTLRYLERGHDVRKFSILEKLPFDRRIFFSHLTPDLINIEKIKRANAKIIYTYRNPKDQMVSWYKFLSNIPLGKFEPFSALLKNGWDEFVDHVLAGRFDMNLKSGEWYPDHILSWYPHRDNKTVYFVAYEDMKKNLFEEVKKLSQFLNISLQEEELEMIADACGFEKMKKAMIETKQTDQTVFKFLRKGTVGDWKNHFDANQSERVDEIMNEKLTGTDIKFTYEI